MSRRRGESRIAPAWWAAIMVAVIVGCVVLSWAVYLRVFTSYVPVTLSADRSGLQLESGGAVKMRGVKIGRISSVEVASQNVNVNLEIEPSQIKYIPANVDAKITASTAFGNKSVELITPKNPSTARLSSGAILHSMPVGTEVNTVFDNLVELLHHIDPSKLNAILTTLADGLRGRAETIGQAVTASNEVLTDLNSRSETIRKDLRALGGFSDAYSGAAQDLLSTLDAISTTGTTIVDQRKALDSLLLNVSGLSQSGINLLGPTKDNLVQAVNTLEPTTNLLLKYNPEYTCLLVGAKNALDAVYPMVGGNGRTILVDAALLPGNDPYVYPDNLPIVAAKGGPGGKPSCGSLPDVAKNFPVRELVTNTGWGTGIDIRNNLGLGHPCYANWFPVTRGIPQPPSVRCQGPPSPGLVVPPTGPLPPFAPQAAPEPGPPLGPPPLPGAPAP